MTFAEFLALVEEYDLPVDEPERFRFMIRDMTAAEFRAHLESEKVEPVWINDGWGNLTDGRGNRWLSPDMDEDGDSDD